LFLVESQKHILHFVQDDKSYRDLKRQKPGIEPGFLIGAATLANCLDGRSLGSHLFGFAFLAHHFQLAFRGFEFCIDFLLDALCCFLQLG
jgi:hypothetical protein